MAGGILLGLWIFWTIALLILYHKVFTVYYFSLGNGLMKEFVTSIFLGAIMAGLTLYLWYVAAIIIILIGLSSMSKTGSKTPIIIAIILAIVIAIMGIKLKSEMKANKEAETQSQVEQTYNDAYQDSSYEDAVDTGNYENDYSSTEESYVQDSYSEDTETNEYVEEESVSEYVFPDSDTVNLSEADCEGLSADECKIARNEIYARHGRLFKDEALQEYFNNCSWYYGEISPEDFTDDLLNSIELDNLKVISAYEISMGYK